jgi:serine/threonine-protein kinase RsbW
METTPSESRKGLTSRLLIETPSHGSYLAYLRTLVTDLARKIGFSEVDAAKIEMAVDEACSNVVKHAYPPDLGWRWQQADQICLEVRTDEGRLIIEITDRGKRFDFSRYCSTQIQSRLDQMKTSGYGLPIIQHFMDEVQYTSSEKTGNTLRLVKYLKKT